MLMYKKIAILDGDGIGPEVTHQAKKVLQAVAQHYGHHFDYTHAPIGAAAIDRTGTALPTETVDICLDSHAVLFGAVGDPRYDHNPNAGVRPEQGILGIRKALQLFANIRPVKSYESLHHLSPLKTKNIEGVDILILRELTGGIYFGHKSTSADGQFAEDHCTYHASEIERIAILAFQQAQQRRKKLTLVDKANVLETSRLWRRVVQQMASHYPDVQIDYLFVDNAAMQLILAPQQFDVILTENMFGDIISDEASVINGSIGLLPSASIGARHALFEPIHGSYPQAAGKDIANPLGAILSAAMMLDYFGLDAEAQKVRQAARWTLEHNFVTKDIDPVNFYFTSTIGELISDIVQDKIPTELHPENIALRKSTII